MSKILVWGAGAIGGTVAARLRHAGVDVLAIDVWPERVDALNAGITIVAADETFEVVVPSVTPGALNGNTYEVILLAVKPGATGEALDDIERHVDEGTVVVSVQNGLNEDLIAERFGQQRTIGCAVGWEATSVAADRLEQTSPGGFRVGRLDGSTDGRLETVARALGHVADTEVVDNVAGHLWAKLVVSSIIGLAAVNGTRLGPLVQGSELDKRVALAVAREGLEAAAAAGVQAESLAGIGDPSLVVAQDDMDYERAFELLDAMGDTHGAIYPSILQDIDRGVEPEVEHINGRVVEEGRSHGVPTPANAAVVEMVHEIAGGRRERGGDNIARLAETVGIRVPASS